MSKTLRKIKAELNIKQRHLEAVAKKIDVLRRRKTASKGRNKKKG